MARFFRVFRPLRNAVPPSGAVPKDSPSKIVEDLINGLGPRYSVNHVANSIHHLARNMGWIAVGIFFHGMVNTNPTHHIKLDDEILKTIKK